MGGIRGRAERRQQRRAGDPGLGVRLAYPGHGGGKIVVGPPCLGDITVEPGRTEAAPPVGRRPGGGIGLGLGLPRGGGRQVGPLIVGTEIAAGEREGSRDDEPNASADTAHLAETRMKGADDRDPCASYADGDPRSPWLEPAWSEH